MSEKITQEVMPASSISSRQKLLDETGMQQHTLHSVVHQ